MHVARLEARRQADRLTNWSAGVLTSWIFGLFLGAAMHGQALYF